MANDLNKNITIAITAQTDQLQQSITNLNKIIDSLLAQQKQLTDAGKTTSDAFQNNADKIDIFQKSLQNATSQLNTYLSVLNSSATSLQKNQSLITALTTAKDKYSKSVGDNSKKVNELNAAIKTLSSAAQQQQSQTTKSQSTIDRHSKSLGNNAKQAKNLKTNISSVSGALGKQQTEVAKNKKAFDLHKATMDHLKTSFDEIKGISGEFGPSLQDVAQGFNAMKDGLSILQGGLKGVGVAIEADGFGFLLQILQQLLTAFASSSEGGKLLSGIISSIGVAVNKVKVFFDQFMNGLINAVSHPIDSIKELGRMVEQNIINRFTAFGVILDGLIHLDFKKVADGALQAVSGVTNATGKIASAVKTISDGIKQTGIEIGEAYKNGFNKADKASNDFQNKTAHKNHAKHLLISSNGSKTRSSNTKSISPSPKQDSKIDADDQALLSQKVNTAQTASDTISKIDADALKARMDADDKARKLKTQKDKEVAENLKNLGKQVAADALNMLENAIKQQSEAKISALEKQKDSELSNTSLTSGQKLAIQQKFKKKEDQVKAKAFKQEQEASIAQAVINGALAVTKATSQTGVLSPFVIPEIIAETAIEIAKIASQKPPAYADGGLHYASDGRGGMLPGYSRTDNTNAYLRSGEGIVVSEAMRDPWARNLVSAINVGFGGRDFSTTIGGKGFAVGGIFTDGGNTNRYYNQPVNDNKNLANTIAYQMINNFPPVYVDVKDINNQQNILAQTINRVTL
jgi:hypothetical protein